MKTIRSTAKMLRRYKEWRKSTGHDVCTTLEVKNIDDNEIIIIYENGDVKRGEEFIYRNGGTSKENFNNCTRPNNYMDWVQFWGFDEENYCLGWGAGQGEYYSTIPFYPDVWGFLKLEKDLKKQHIDTDEDLKRYIDATEEAFIHPLTGDKYVVVDDLGCECDSGWRYEIKCKQ